ncbi:hypothetical protein NP493_106g07030 [Ridgeia piscesae]|uniref:Uncharacterized protein n=1 Tax=Ridgeia piscesae TaxID=27915 RepID=A0AAD9UHF7_RIDPI|nr:hypothetical protein NP493_106g07030 [Ridgeia piscesae]
MSHPTHVTSHEVNREWSNRWRHMPSPLEMKLTLTTCGCCVICRQIYTKSTRLVGWPGDDSWVIPTRSGCCFASCKRCRLLLWARRTAHVVCRPAVRRQMSSLLHVAALNWSANTPTWFNALCSQTKIYTTFENTRTT